MKHAAVELVVAASENDVIGRATGCRGICRRTSGISRALTLGRHVLMGRKTYESIGKALPDRINLGLEPLARFRAGATARWWRHSTLRARLRARNRRLMVIGGAEIYGCACRVAGRIHLTLVHARIDGRRHVFRRVARYANGRESSRERHEADDKNAYAYSFITLERRGAPAGP